MGECKATAAAEEAGTVVKESAKDGRDERRVHPRVTGDWERPIGG